MSLSAKQIEDTKRELKENFDKADGDYKKIWFLNAEYNDGKKLKRGCKWNQKKSLQISLKNTK